MSWIVIDTNQAGRLPVSPTFPQCADIEGVTIPPFVFGELLRSTNRKPIENLAQYPLRLGMTPGEVMRHIASLRRSQIVAFKPFHNLASQEVQWGLLNPSAQKVQKFVEEVTTHIKTGGDAFCSSRKEVRDLLKLQGCDPRNFKLAGFAEALQKLATGSGNMIEWLLIQSVSDDGMRNVRACPHALYTGAMQNPYLRHYFYTLLWYVLSYQQVWAKQHDEWNISIKNNDWTDITLSLYTAPGDIILTADSTVRKAVSAVDPGGVVRVMLATDL